MAWQRVISMGEGEGLGMGFSRATNTSLGPTEVIKAKKRVPLRSMRVSRSPDPIRRTFEMCFASGPVMEQVPSLTIISSTKKRLKVLLLTHPNKKPPPF
jgi:hypothetical protein